MTVFFRSVAPFTAKISFWLFLALCGMAAPSLSTAQTPASRPNILWLTTEDIGPHLGAYGDSFAQTPNLDRFAARGLRFTRAWSNYPVCAPARTTIISGQYPHSNGSEHMRSEVPAPEGLKMYPEYLREAGYFCTNNQKEDFNLAKTGQLWDQHSNKAHWNARAPGQPFFAIFNFTVTHESQIREPKDYQLQQDTTKVPVPPYHPDTPEIRRDWTRYYENITRMDQLFQRRLDELDAAGLAEDTIVFFFGDHGSGMPRNKRTPLNQGLRVPLVVHFPEKWKHLAPAGYAPGAASSELVSFVDLAPTLLSLIGREAPQAYQGRAFCGPHGKPAPSFLYGGRGRMDARYDMVRSVTDGRFTYARNYLPHIPYGQHVHYMFQTPTTQIWHDLWKMGQLTEVQKAFWLTKPTEELYDTEADPWEIHNLATTAEHAGTLARLRRAHLTHAKNVRDLGFIPEGERLRLAEGKSPKEVFASEQMYPLEEVLEFASLAAGRDATTLPALTRGLQHPNAVLRYWAVTGLIIRGEDAVKSQANVLNALLKDPSPSVRVTAAEALVAHGEEGQQAVALEVLASEADPVRGNYGISLEALNALDRLGSKAVSVLPTIRDLPLQGNGPKRLAAAYATLLKSMTSSPSLPDQAGQ